MAEALWPGGPVWSGAPDVFPLGTDAILLADFARPHSGDRVLDLGTGSGVLPLLLSAGQPGLRVTAVDISPAACALARKNLADNRMEGTVLEADLREYKSVLPCGGFDLTVSNPPYFAAGSGAAPAPHRRTAREDGTCTLPQLCAAAAWSTRWGGSFCMVFRPERLGELFSTLEQAGFAPKRLRPVHHAPGRAVSLLLIEARRGGKPGLLWEPDLYLFTAQGQESPEYRRICRRTC